MVEIDSSVVGEFYSRYISRDLADLLGGALFIEIIWFSVKKTPLLFSTSAGDLFRLIGFLAVSYLVGFLFDKIGDHIVPLDDDYRIKDHIISLKDLPFDYKSGLVLKQHIIEKCDKKIIDQLERYISLWILGKSVGLAALLGGSFMIYMTVIRITPCFEALVLWILSILLFIFGYIFMFIVAREVWIQYHNERYFLIEAIRKDEIPYKKV